MNTSKSWNTWHNKAIIETDNELLAMMGELCVVIRTLDKVYGEQAKLVTSSIISDWRILSSIAFNRGIKDFPSPLRSEDQ